MSGLISAFRMMELRQLGSRVGVPSLVTVIA